MNRRFHDRCSAVRPDSQKKSPGAEFRKFDVQHEGPSGKTLSKIRRGLETIAIAPLTVACASGQFMDPKNDWFSYKVVGIFLSALVIAAAVQHFVERRIQKRQQKEMKG